MTNEEFIQNIIDIWKMKKELRKIKKKWILYKSMYHRGGITKYKNTPDE